MAATASAYSAAQIAQYLDLVGLSQRYRPNAAEPLPRDFHLLNALHVHQISTIPYENLSLHYKDPKTQGSAYDHHTVSGAYMNLDPQYLFDKFVTRGYGRGGYCFQVVTFFAHILRGMGFAHVYTAQARIRIRDSNGVPEGNYVGFRHAVNIVTLDDGTRWDLDVSFGGDGPISPLPLVDGAVRQNVGSQQLRLVKDYIPEQYDKINPQKIWIYQYRNGSTNADGSEKEWNSYYAFGEIEAVAMDLEVSNWHTSQHPASFQALMMLVVKFLARDKGSVSGVSSGQANGSNGASSDQPSRREIYGKIMLAGNTVKRNTGGRTEVLAVCHSELDRVKALKEYFQIDLFPEEIKGIVGGVTELTAAVAA